MKISLRWLVPVSSRASTFALLAGIVSLGQPLAAQEQAVELVDSGDAVTLKEVVLYGLKSERSFLGTSESVGVLTGETIQKTGVDDLRKSFSLLGNVRLFEGNRGNAGFVIRGLSSEGVTESSNNAPLTSVIIDGATQSVEATRRGARGLWDVGQVEIYRGPQATLQGRGALAGAVVVESNDPTFTPEAKLRGIVGSGDRHEGAFMVSGPVVADVLAIRISGEARGHSRDIHFNTQANKTIGEDAFRNLRAKLLFVPADAPELSLKLTYSDTYDKPGVNAVNGPDFFAREFSTAATSAVEVREARNKHAVFEASYVFGNDVVLTAVSSHIDAKTRIYAPSGFDYAREETRAGKDFTQDIRLNFGSEDADLNGVIGLFYGNFTLPRKSLVTRVDLPFPIQDLTSDDRTVNRAVYADLNWRVAPDWVLNLGGRYAHETVRERQTGTSFNLPISADEQTESRVFLPKLGLTWQFDEFQTLAVTVRRGYRSGFTALENGAATDVAPEYLWSHELAWRIEDPEGGWRLGATAFLSKYSDQQIVIPAQLPTLPTTENAGRSRMWGAELEGSREFDNGLTLFGSLGYLRTRFDDFRTSAGDYTGNEFPEAPHWTGSLGVTYNAPSGLFASAVASFTDGYFATGSIENDPSLRLGGFGTVDVQMGYDTGDLRTLLYVDNLFDRQYLTSLHAGGEATISDRRTIGLQVEKTF